MHRFSYQGVKVPPTHGDRSPILWRPMMPVRIWGLRANSLTQGLVDTGAAETILPMSLWDEIGPAFRGGEIGYLEVANGAEIKVQYGTVDLDIKLGRKRHRWSQKVGFTEDRDELVLGDMGFFRYFWVAFNRHDRYFAVRLNGELPRAIMPRKYTE